jgi:hypothetical protein
MIMLTIDVELIPFNMIQHTIANMRVAGHPGLGVTIEYSDRSRPKRSKLTDGLSSGLES